MAELKLTWNLDDIVKLDQFDQLMTEVKKDIAKFRQWLQKLQPDMSEASFIEYMDFAQAANERLNRVEARPVLAETVDETSQPAKVMKAKAKELYLSFTEAARPIDLWLKGFALADKKPLDEKNAQRLFKAVPQLTYVLTYARVAAKHTLAEEQENIIAAKDSNGLAVLNDLRQLITTEFKFTLKLPKQKPKLITSEEKLISLSYRPDPVKREAAFKALLATYKDNSTKLFTIYQAIVKDWAYEANLRGYKSPISMRNFANHIPDRAIEALMAVCEANVGLFQDYFRFKAGQLGLKKLRRFDIYAPLESTTKKYPLAQAIELVMEAFSEFSANFASRAKQILAAKHLDSHPGENKHGGGFCSTITPQITPYVFMNYTETLRDVSTLAHELGHGVHSLYASDLPIFAQQANLPLAETASTLGEMILFEKLLDQASDDRERKLMLSDKMSEAYAAICRQNFFVKAELEAHQRMPQGLSADEMGKIWLKTLQQQFGDSVEVDPIFAYEWARIPHIFHTPFYCYAYNFGELLSLALFNRYKKDGPKFVPKIEMILSAGGSRDPQKVLAQVGIDMTDRKFWQGSFEILQDWMKHGQDF